MSSDVALRIQGLGKKYSIRHKDHDHVTMAQAALHRLRHPRGALGREEFWALRDVSFEVPRGQVLGVIGHNGAGKSTLLKILSRITPPTTGRVEVFGRIGSLLEVGTGFHPELTGRENIYLNGSILGMRTKEIDRQFDAIVDFSGVEKFLDTPVKRYSSGMYVRLAFAVAAHLDTEILLMDEVLAVGDAEFQKKSINAMREAASGGRTVMLVSHHMATIASLCQQALWLRDGGLVATGTSSAIIDQYAASQGPLITDTADLDRRRGSGEFRVVQAAATRASFRCEEVKEVELVVERRRGSLSRYFVSLEISDERGAVVAHADSRLSDFWVTQTEGSGPQRFRIAIRSPWLKPGNYVVSAYLCNAGVLDFAERCCGFTVSPALPYDGPASEDAMASSTVLADFSYSLAS